jgi:hypothetical protein
MLKLVAAVALATFCLWQACAWAEEPAPKPAEGAKTPGIFVPKPKGADETLDTSVKPADKGPALDTLLGLRGEQLFGTVVGMDGEGKIEFTSRMIEGRPKIPASAVESILLAGTETEPVSHRVVLTSGDVFIGKLTSITAEAVVLETQAAGRLSLPRAAVSSITLASQVGTEMATNLALGDLGPWQVKPGGWVCRRGRLVAQQGNPGPIWVKTDLKGPCTFMVTVRVPEGTPTARLTLFANQPGGTPPTTNLSAMIFRNECRVEYRSPTRGSSASSSYNDKIWPNQATLRLTYDPNGGLTRFWGDSQNMAGLQGFTVDPAAAQYAVFEPLGPMEIESLAILPGVVTPASKDQPADPKAAADAKPMIDFTNADHLQFTSLSAADEKVQIGLPGGKLDCPMERLTRIVFGSAVKPPALKAGQALIACSAGRFIGKIKSLSATELVIQSDVLGEVRVRRAAVREISFGQEEPAPAAASALSPQDGWRYEIEGKAGSVEAPDAFADIDVANFYR